MSFNPRLRRVTDLFVEGVPLHLGTDDEGPVYMWINKPNSFQIEEARRDGQAQRGAKMVTLGDPQNPRRQAIMAELGTWTMEALVDALAKQRADDVYLDVLNDIETDPEWREKLEMMRRLPGLLDDERADINDPRRDQVASLQQEYILNVSSRHTKAVAELRETLADETRESAEALYFERWREQETLDDYMAGKRITELFLAMRQCEATGDPAFLDDLDHSACDHSKRFLDSRAEVRDLPSALEAKIAIAFDEQVMTDREAGNSDAPGSSSASSEQSGAPEAESTHSSQVETQPAAPMS